MWVFSRPAIFQLVPLRAVNILHVILKRHWLPFSELIDQLEGVIMQPHWGAYLHKGAEEGPGHTDGCGSRSHNWQMTHEPCQVTMPHQACQKTFLVTMFTQKGTKDSLIKNINSKFSRPLSLGNLWNLVFHLNHFFTTLMSSFEHERMERSSIGYNTMGGRKILWDRGKHFELGIRRPLFQFWFLFNSV